MHAWRGCTRSAVAVGEEDDVQPQATRTVSDGVQIYGKIDCNMVLFRILEQFVSSDCDVLCVYHLNVYVGKVGEHLA